LAAEQGASLSAVQVSSEMTALDGWHDYLKTYDHAALRALLRPSVFTTSCLRRV
jgi:hypothetical protein